MKVQITELIELIKCETTLGEARGGIFHLQKLIPLQLKADCQSQSRDIDKAAVCAIDKVAVHAIFKFRAKCERSNERIDA